MRRGRLLRGTVGDWYQDRAQQLGAALPFYTCSASRPASSFSSRSPASSSALRPRKRGVRYVERDVTVDVAALDELSALGVVTTPVTTINGEVVIGLDQKRLDALLGR